MKKLNDISIRIKFSVATLLLTMGISIFIYLYFPPRLQREATNTIARKAESIASMTAYAMVPALAFDDAKAAQEIFDAARQNDDLLYLVVCNTSGKVAFEFNLKTATAIRFAEPMDRVLDDEYVYKTNCAITAGKRPLGTLYLGLSLESLKVQVKESKTAVAWVSLLVFVGGFVLAFGVSTILTRPLRKVADIVERIAQGNLTERAIITSRDEVGLFATSFNRMVDTLVTTQRQLEDVNHTLEQRVQRRTAELQTQIDGHKRTKEALQRREAIIETVAAVAEQFLRNEHWETNIQSVLQMLGSATNVSRTYIFRKETGPDNSVRVSQLYEWSAEGITPQISNPDMTMLNLRAAGLERWETALMEGNTIAHIVRMLPGHEQDIFRAQEIKSVMVVPVFVELKWWGFLGFDDCVHEREWTASETDALKTAARNLGSAIERELALRALSLSEERYRRFFDEDLTGDFTATGDGTLLSCNSAFVQMFGFTSINDAVGTKLAELFPLASQFEELLSRLRNERILTYHELSLRRKDNNTAYVVTNLIGSLDESGQLTEMRGYIFDDTRRTILEQQLRQAQKMESLGTIAGGVAHDFNNILSIVVGYATLLSEPETSGEQLSKGLETIIKASHRGAGLVRQLLTFARKASIRIELVDLNNLVAETAKLLAQTFPKTISIETHLEENLPLLLADATQLNQVLLNLCVNARDAMQAPGVLTITTRKAGYEMVKRRFLEAKEAAYVELAVADTGEGISEEARKKIFEPFFTTKEFGKGTGLGLSVVFGIIEHHKGFIDVESSVGKGTTFRMYFPIQTNGQKVAGNRPEKIDTIRGGTETILLVEDEDALRLLAESELTKRGYHVLTAVDGEEALSIYQQHSSEISLVVTDMGLPKLDGEHLFISLRNLDKNLKVMVASGFLEPGVVQRLRTAGITDLIDKPYAIDLLLQKIRSVLESAPQA